MSDAYLEELKAQVEFLRAAYKVDPPEPAEMKFIEDTLMTALAMQLNVNTLLYLSDIVKEAIKQKAETQEITKEESEFLNFDIGFLAVLITSHFSFDEIIELIEKENL